MYKKKKIESKASKKFELRFDDDRRPAPDYIRLMDADEAISSNWVTETGERVWVVPAKDENHYITFVWSFDDYNKAELFFSLMKEEIGRETEGNDPSPGRWRRVTRR